jgi:hypothetical protein
VTAALLEVGYFVCDGHFGDPADLVPADPGIRNQAAVAALEIRRAVLRFGSDHQTLQSAHHAGV